MTILGLIATIALTSACAHSPQLIKTSVAGTRGDIYQELTDGGSPPQGYADLRIVSSLKTHKPDLYPAEMKSHGTRDYRLLVNIDGQATWAQGRLHEENIEPRGNRDPEAGEGIRYRFNKALRLRAGTHTVRVAVPEDGVVVERQVTLRDGSVNELVVEPIYGIRKARKRLAAYTETSFLEGLRGFGMKLNGEPL